MSYTRLTEQQWNEIVRLYQARTHSLRDLGLAYDVSLEWIRRGLLKRGIPINPPYRHVKAA